MPLRDPVWPSRYHSLDTLRLLAAIGVVLHHIAGVDMGVLTGRVVVFFVISGYAVSASLRRSFETGAGAAAFVQRRSRRIFGPYLCSLAYWVALTGLGLTAASAAGITAEPSRWLTNLTLTQWIPCALSPGRPPWRREEFLIPAHWSLVYEMQFYLLAAGVVWLGSRWAPARRAAIPAAILAAAGLAWAAFAPRAMCGLLVEFAVPFAIGGLVYWRLCEVRSPARARFIDAAFATGALAAIAWCNLDSFTGANRRSVPEEIAVALSLGFLLIAFRPFDGAWHASPVGRRLDACGAIAFALFLVHPINIPLARSLAGRALPGHAPLWLMTGVELAVHIALAAAFWWFTQRALLRRRPAPATAPPTFRSGPAPARIALPAV